MHADTASGGGSWGGDGVGPDGGACGGGCQCRRRVASLIGGPPAARLSQHEACASAARLGDFYAYAFWSAVACLAAGAAAGYAVARLVS